MTFTEFNKHLEEMITGIGTPYIKILTGSRPCGKTRILGLLKTHIQESIADANIIHISLDLEEFDALLEYKALYDYVNSKYIEGRKNFLLIDDVHMCDYFERAINDLFKTQKFDIFITGSNNDFLSSEVSSSHVLYRIFV